jgi:ring-1,2-phenylacetyl-CoA epoxidase subunit PaaD
VVKDAGVATAEQLAVAAVSRQVESAAPADGKLLVARAWDALAGVPDPEIPMVSIVELGIVREVRVDAGVLAVDVTPTYSGCPATEVILRSIEEALAAAGISPMTVANVLAPAWTTDWIAPEAKGKLRAFGIAPAHVAAPRIDVAGISPLRRAPIAVPCPRCGSVETRLVAQFGSTACKAHYRCGACLEPFDYFKPH